MIAMHVARRGAGGDDAADGRVAQGGV